MEAALAASVLKQVVAAVERTTFVGEVPLTPKTHLRDDLGLGRFGRIRLALALEDMFDIELRDEVIEQVATLGDIVRYLSRRYFRDIEPAALAYAA